jgi:amino acid transporter
MAAAAPLSVVVGLMPIAFAFGNGGGLPGTYLFTVAAMLLFAVGYVRIMPYVRNAGAFYAYITASVGPGCGLAAAYVAALSYISLSGSTLTILAFYMAQFVEALTGVKYHWVLWAALSLIALTVLSYHHITLAAKVLGIALSAEVALILLLDGAIVHHAAPFEHASHGVTGFDQFGSTSQDIGMRRPNRRGGNAGEQEGGSEFHDQYLGLGHSVRRNQRGGEGCAANLRTVSRIS